EIDDGGGEKRQKLAQDEAADDGDAERTAKFGADSGINGERQRAQKRGHSGHEDRTKAKQAGLIDGFDGSLALLGFRLDREIDHQDGVFLHDADEKDDADERDHAEFRAREHEREKSADARGRKRGENRDGVDIALVKDAENDVHSAKSGDNEDQFRRLGVLEGLGGALKAGMNGGRHADFLLGLLDVRHGIAE